MRPILDTTADPARLYSAAQAVADGLGGMDLKHLSDLGVVVALVWFLYYTVAVRDPKREEEHRRELEDRERAYRAEADQRERKQNEEMRDQRRDYIESLNAVAERNSREREEFRRTMEKMAESVDGVVAKVNRAIGDVTDMERTHAAALVKLSHTIDRSERAKEEERKDHVEPKQ